MTRALLLDEMLAPKIAEQLRRRGLDVVAVTERPDLVGATDTHILATGADEDRVVVTANIADFASLHAAWLARDRSHAGVVFVSTATFPQSRGFVGALVAALIEVERIAGLPSHGETVFLHRG